MTAVDTCLKNKETSSNLQILPPAAFCFKEEGVLANHPPSCHPWRVFGCLENRKERERKLKQEEAGKYELKASQKFIVMLIDCHLLQTEAYICSEKGKLQNNMKQQNYSEGRKEKNQNGVFWIKNRATIFAMHSEFRYDSENSL